jgi:hypothetical protein
LFLTVCLEEPLIPGSFEHTLKYLIDHFDLSAFDTAFHTTIKALPLRACLIELFRNLSF